MDTVDVRLTLGRPLEATHINYIVENIKWISRLRYWDNKCSFVVSFPKFFYSMNNAYLVETQKDVDLVLNSICKIFENYNIQEAYSKRIDYPFTFIMPAGRTFNSYFELFRLVGIIKSKSSTGNSKYYGSLVNDEKETAIFTNTTNVSNFSKRVMLYNQALKIRESRHSSYDETLNKFNDLEQRMRIEVSFKREINLLQGKTLKLDLGKIKREYAYYLANEIFSRRSIEEGIKAQSENLLKHLKEKYSTNINWNKMVAYKITDQEQVISKDIFNSVVKELDLSDRGKQNARKTLREIAGETEMTYENIGKDLAELMTAVLMQAKKN